MSGNAMTNKQPPRDEDGYTPQERIDELLAMSGIDVSQPPTGGPIEIASSEEMRVIFRDLKRRLEEKGIDVNRRRSDLR